MQRYVNYTIKITEKRLIKYTLFFLIKFAFFNIKKLNLISIVYKIKTKNYET
jgi:hypothetical protein